jgi:hypothetical protein
MAAKEVQLDFSNHATFPPRATDYPMVPDA